MAGSTQLAPVYIPDIPDDPNAVGLDVGSSPDTSVNMPVPGVLETPLPPQVAKERASKASQGVGPILQKSEDRIYQDMLDGQENNLRKQAASQLDVQKAQQRNELITKLAIAKGGPLDPEEVQNLTNPANPLNQQTDPDTVIERMWASDYIKTMGTVPQFAIDSLLTKAQQTIPKQTQDTLDEGSELLTKNNYIRTQLQNNEMIVDQQSKMGWLADQAKTLFQPYVEFKERGNIGGFLSGIGLGSNLDEAHSILYRMPLPEFKKRFDAVMDYLSKDNPSLASQWAQSMLGQSGFESALNNTFSAIAIPDYYAIGKGFAAVSKSVGRLNQVRKATKDMVDSGVKEPNATAATRAEGAGDLGEAAVQRVVDQNKAALTGTGDPIKDAKQTLLSTWQDDFQKFTANPGTYLSRELLTRIQDKILRDGEALYNRLASMNRVERTPEAVTNPDVIRAYKDSIIQDYKGPQNTLADIEGPIREPLSGTYWYKSKIVQYDGTQFADKETAEGFAKTQLHLAEPVIDGEAPGKLYISEAAAKKIESIKTTPAGTKFYVDNGIEVVPTTKPEPGLVPYNVKTGQFEKTLTEQTSVLEQQGLGFHISVWTPMRENGDLIRDLMIRDAAGNIKADTVSAATSASGVKRLLNSVLGIFRTSNETLSKNESAQRNVATYTQSNIQKWADGLRQELEDIAAGRIKEDPITGEPLNPAKVHVKAWFGKLTNREVAQQLERTIDYARKAFDPDGRPGYNFKTAGELQNFYNTNWKRDPSYLETKAYFNFFKMVEGDRMMAEVAEFRNRARVGTEQHAISVYNPATGMKETSSFFDGIRSNVFPGGDEYILVMGKNKGDETLHKLGHIDDKKVKTLRENVSTGRGQVIRLYDAAHQPLTNFSELARDKLISYVYTESSEAKPIGFSHVERRGGGHFEWDYDQYLKIGDVRPQYHAGLNDKRPGLEHLYMGDITIMPIKTRKMGQDIAKLWNEAHDLINAGKWEEVKPITAKLGIDHQKFTGWYHAGRDANGNPLRPLLDPKERVVVVDKNTKIIQMNNELRDRYRTKIPGTENYRDTLVDMTNKGPANNFKVAYNQERNSSFEMRTIEDVGTQGNPIYQYQPAEMVDPITTMNRALNRAVNSTFMDDMKHYSVEHWLREAEPYLAAKGGKAEIRSTPYSWFEKPEWVAGTPKSIVNNLMANRFKIKQFVGTPNSFDNFVHEFTSTLADNFYTKYGPEGSRTITEKARTLVPIWALHHVTDPFSFMRSVTFNFKLGLGAIPQFLVQAQTHALIWALEPRHGTVGTYHALLHGWSKFTAEDAVLDHLDKMATKLNMFGSKARPGEFLEARRELNNSGFEHVAGEYANINDQMRTSFIQNDWNKALKIGQTPFRLGEQSTRVSAWYTAFREFREANPTLAITNKERAEILAKADLLTVNMSRASNSMLNHGAFSLSTQFLTYQIKLAELFWGKRLGETATDRMLARARIVTGFSLLYGVPNAIGVTGLPFSDNIRQHFMDDLGYIPGEKWASTMINEGWPAWQIAMITGKLPNFGDRFGSQGFQNIKQALRGDIPMALAIGGASTSTFYNLISSTLDPYYQFLASWYRGDGNFRIKSADLVEPLKEISSYSTFSKWWTAMHTGDWVSKNEQVVTKVDMLNATLYGLTGMQPQEQDDMFQGNQMIKGEEELKKRVLKDITKDWRRGIEARANNDIEQSNQYFANAKSRGIVSGMSPSEITTAITIATRNMGTAVDAANWNQIKQGDFQKRMDRMEQFRRKLQMK